MIRVNNVSKEFKKVVKDKGLVGSVKSLFNRKYDIVKAAIAKKALPKCNLEFIAGEDMKAAVSGYLNILFTSNPKSVGGKMPADDFYYTK